MKVFSIVIALLISALLLSVLSCGKSNEEDLLTVHLDEWQTDCPPRIMAGDEDADSQNEPYVLKIQVETTSLWTSVEVSGLESVTSTFTVSQGDGEIDLNVEGLEVSELSRPENGANVGQKLVLDIDAIVRKRSESAVFRIRKENSGTTVYTLSYDSGDAIKEIARFTNNVADRGDNLETFRLDLHVLPASASFSARRYNGPLFDAHVHLVGSRDVKHTHAEDDRLHINPDTADEIFSVLDDENISGLIGFLPVIHEHFDDDDSFNQPHQDQTLAVVNRPDNKIIPFLHPKSHIGIPPNKDGPKLLDLIDRNTKKTGIPFRGIGEIHTSYPQTDSYYEMRLTDPVMLDLYDYAAANDLILMIHPESVDIEDLNQALRHNPKAVFLLHGIIDSGGDDVESIAELLGALFREHSNVYFSVDAALMLDLSLHDACIYDKEQFMANLQSGQSYYSVLADSLALWKPVIEAHPTRMMWGTDMYYWWHYEPDVIHVIVQFGRDFIARLDPEAREGFAHRNASELLNSFSR